MSSMFDRAIKEYPWLTSGQASLKNTETLEHVYFTDLIELALVRFKWLRLPKEIDPRFLEMVLLQDGRICFHHIKGIGYIVTRGSELGGVNYYGNPITHKPVFTGNMMKSIFSKKVELIGDEATGVMIYGNKLRRSMIPNISVFASNLAFYEGIIKQNINAQRTPKILYVDSNNKNTMKEIIKETDRGALYIMLDKKQHNSINDISVLDLQPTYIADKVNVQMENEWNKILTNLGINNSSINKRERVNVEEAKSNDQHIKLSGDVHLSERKIACERINELFPELDIDVELNEEFEEKLKEVKEKHGSVEEVH